MAKKFDVESDRVGLRLNDFILDTTFESTFTILLVLDKLDNSTKNVSPIVADYLLPKTRNFSSKN